MDTTRNRLIVWGGGHNDYAGNEVYAVNLADQTVTRLNNPSVPTNYAGACGVTTLADGNPNSRHTYDSLAYVANLDKMFVFGGAITCVNGGFTRDTWLLDFASLTWRRMNPSGPIPNAVPGVVTGFDPNTNKVFLHDGTSLFSYDPVADVYQILGTSQIDYHLTGVIDPVRKKFVMIGGGQAWMYDIGPTSNYTRQPLATTGGEVIVNSVYPGLAYDSAAGKVVAWQGGDTVYTLDVASGVWSSTTYAGGPGAPQVNGTFKHWSYSPASGVFVLVNSMTQNAYALRTGAAVPDTTPDAFAFAPQSGVALNTLVTSSSIVVSGIDAAAPISVTGGTYSVNGAAYVATAATVNLGDTVRLQLPSSSSNSTQTCATLTIGGVAGQFCVTTLAAVNPPPDPTQNSFSLNSAATQTLAPFTIGLGFKKGDIPGTPALDIPDQQVVAMRRWNDGSVKHAIASGHVSLSAGVPKTITAYNAASGSGTNLSAASIQAANPQASIAFGAYGTVNLTSLLASPFRTFISGPEMVEAHYRGQVGSDPTLVAWFHVRLYKNGKVWIRAIGENGYLDVATADKNYVPVVSVGGSSIWNNGNATLLHYAHTRWAQEGWVGGDPQIVPTIDTTYLKSSRLVPNYTGPAPAAATLDGLYQNYAPNQNGNWSASMPDPGYQAQIGLLPRWDALFVSSGADLRAYKSVIANAKALNSYPIEWNDSVTKLPTKPSDRPNWSLDGPDGGGSSSRTAGALTWDTAHHGSGGYLAYLVTGDYYFLETMENQLATAYLMAGPVDYSIQPSGSNLGTSRYFNGQTRGYAWTLRTLSQYAAIAPSTSGLNADYSTLLANNIAHLKAAKDTISPAGTGYVYEYDASLYGIGIVAPWQQHFMIQALGMGSNLEPLSTMAPYIDLRDYLYRAAVGILGDGSGYCFTEASVYNLKSNDGNSNSNIPNNWYKTWAQVYAATFPSPPPCANTLSGSSGSAPGIAAQGYWGNLMPAIAYAVDHAATGAAGAWARLTGASNWNVVLQSGFDSTPTWGIFPRPVNPPADSTPDPFSFTPVTGVALSAPITSGAITVTGINVAAPISVAGGSYSVNGTGYVSVAGTVNQGASVTVRLTSSATNSTQTCAALAIGGLVAQFCATTLAPPADTTPDPFSFVAQNGVALSALVTSNAITVTGISAAAPISVAGGSYSVNGAAYVTAAGTVNQGASVTVRLISSATNSTQTCAALSIGGVLGQFCATTLAPPPDTTPDAFSFVTQTGVAVNAQVTSNAITISGINAAAPISVTGGSYSVNGAAYVATAGTVNQGDSVSVRLTSSASSSTQTCAALVIGGVSASFCAITGSAQVNPVVTLAVGGHGSGNITSDVGGINCGATCSGSVAQGTTVTLTATAGVGSSFAGWLGPCTGTGTCVFVVSNSTTVSANFIVAGNPSTLLDADGNNQVDALTDGMLILRFLLGLRDASLTNGVVSQSAGRPGATAIADYLTDIKPLLDIDGDGRVDASTDGLLILRYLFGLRGDMLIAAAVAPNSLRTTVAGIEAQLRLVIPN
ncbi:MAG: hypothetical protein ABIS68_08915 [Casimicrobiaceae bacterium]